MTQAQADLAKGMRRLQARSRLRRSDVLIGLSALFSASSAMLLAAGSQEAAGVLAVACTALLAGQRWALGLVITAELMLVGSLCAAAVGPADLPAATWLCIAATLPGLASLRRGAAALVVLTGLRRTRFSCRVVHAVLLAVALLSGCIPLL